MNFILIKKCFNYHKSVTDCHEGEESLVSGFVSKIVSKYTVCAKSGENDVKEDNNNAIDSEKSETIDKLSVNYINLMTEQNVWQSFKHLFRRRVDTSGDNYRKQFTVEGESGADRVRLMWGAWANGEDSPEVRFVMQALTLGALAGFVYGGIIANRGSTQDYIRRHNEFVFRGQFEAKRKVQDSMFLSFGRQGWRWGWRMGVFSALLTGLTGTAIAYRNDVFYGDCAAVGGSMCALWKAKLGLRAMAVSGVLGTVFGLVFASSVRLLLWTFNTTVPEYRYWRQNRYLGHLTVQEYSDGTTEYNWDAEGGPKSGAGVTGLGLKSGDEKK